MSAGRWKRAGVCAVVAATATVVLAAGGSLDEGFGTGGVASTAGQACNPNDVAVQGDGKTLVGGNRATGQSMSGGSVVSWRIERYTAAGALDAGFGTSGAVSLFGSGASENLADLAIDGSARCIAVGTSNMPGKKAGSFTAMATAVRLTSSGSLDASFGSGGIARFVVPGASEQTLSAVAVQSDGRLVVAGGAWFSAHGASYSAPWVARLLANGAMDPGFGSGGFSVDTRIANTAGVTVRAVALQSGGQIVVAQNASSLWTITRLLPGGGVDTGFAPIVSAGDRVQGLAVDGQNRIVATGNHDVGGGLLDAVVARYAPSGSVDATFGAAGRATLHVYASQTFETDPAFQSDGGIVVGMSAATTPGLPQNFDGAATVRLLDSGAVDSTYGAAGTGAVLSLAGSGQATWARGLGLDPIGAAMLGGRSSGGTNPYVWFVARYLSN